jgi:hypothetical protein
MRTDHGGSFQLRSTMNRGKLALLAAGIVAACVGAGCSSSSGAALNNGDDADAASGDDTSKDAGGTGSKDSGQSNPKGDAGGACGTRVNSGVVFADAGVILCAQSMPCDLTSNTCCVGLATTACKPGHNGCGGGTGLAAEAALSVRRRHRLPDESGLLRLRRHDDEHRGVQVPGDRRGRQMPGARIEHAERRPVLPEDLRMQGRVGVRTAELLARQRSSVGEPHIVRPAEHRRLQLHAALRPCSPPRRRVPVPMTRAVSLRRP